MSLLGPNLWGLRHKKATLSTHIEYIAQRALWPDLSIDQMFEYAQVQHLGIAQDVPNAENRHIRLVGQPVTLSRTPSKMAARPPEFGEQTDEVLSEFGFSAQEITEAIAITLYLPKHHPLPLLFPKPFSVLRLMYQGCRFQRLTLEPSAYDDRRRL